MSVDSLLLNVKLVMPNARATTPKGYTDCWGGSRGGSVEPPKVNQKYRFCYTFLVKKELVKLQ